MNFRSMSMDELAGYLRAETRHARFINGAKEFVARFLTTQYYTEEQYNEAVKKALARGRDEGYQDAMDDNGI